MGAATDASEASPGGAAPGAVLHVVAELRDVAPPLLHDATLIGGLLIAAASAAGVHAVSPPLMRHDATRGVDAVLLIDGGHVSAHGFAERHVLLVDFLVPTPAELVRAIEVFTRRLGGTTSAAQLVRLQSRTAGPNGHSGRMHG